MIEIIKEFHNIDFIRPLGESIFLSNDCEPTTSLVKEVYDKGHELALNLNDEIQKLTISDTDTFVGVIHKTTYDICNMTMINIKSPINPIIKDQTINVQMSGNDIKSRLSKIPDLIMTTISYLEQYVKDNCSENDVIENTHSYIDIMSRAALELIGLTKMNDKTLTESDTNVEDVSEYVDELKKIIEEIREYYEKSDYSKILTPRKKTIEKMTEYMKGALDRKYTLRIPLYKIENADKTTRDVVENKIIKDIQGIVAKYDNYAVLSPSWDEEEDIFIYLTLKEPFGKEGDKEDRVVDSSQDQINKEENPKADTNANKDEPLTEASNKLSKADRDALSDDEFGLPELRKYPLNDETHIKEAIKFFHFCKGENKQTLANNIAKAVKTKKLVGKVTVSKKHPFKKYFPDWMIEDTDTKAPKDKTPDEVKNETVVFINDKLI